METFVQCSQKMKRGSHSIAAAIMSLKHIVKKVISNWFACAFIPFQPNAAAIQKSTSFRFSSTYCKSKNCSAFHSIQCLATAHSRFLSRTYSQFVYYLTIISFILQHFYQSNSSRPTFEGTCGFLEAASGCLQHGGSRSKWTFALIDKFTLVVFPSFFARQTGFVNITLSDTQALLK